MTTFLDLGVSPSICEALRYQGIEEPTPVQEAAIPAVRAGKDCIVQAQTGTGKTLAFLLPVMEKIKTRADNVQALVVTPTRELAIQIAKVAKIIGEASDIRTLAIYGGQDIERQKLRLQRGPQIIIGTPGRLLDHIRRHTIDLSQVNKIVLDEADEMLHLGFIEDVEVLLKETAGDRQLLLFSATMPDRVRALSTQFMRAPQNIKITGDHVTLDNIEQIIIDSTEETKIDQLSELINKENPYLMMVFCHTKQRAHMVTMALAARGYLVDELHGDMSQSQRALVLRRFRKAELQILCTTDIAARGLDIEGITHVVNYDIPQNAEWYIHRIGRTGRAGSRGKAITFVNARQYDILRKIEAGIKNRIQKAHSEHHKKHEKKQKQMLEKIRAEREAEKKKHSKPLSKYANRKGSSHKGRNPRSRRQQPQPGKRVTNIGHRSNRGRH